MAGVCSFLVKTATWPAQHGGSQAGPCTLHATGVRSTPLTCCSGQANPALPVATLPEDLFNQRQCAAGILPWVSTIALILE